MIRPLLPGPDAGLREAVEALGADPGSLSLLAAHASVEAIAIDGLRADETRVLERQAAEVGAVLIASPDGHAVLILGALAAVASLPQRLRDWGSATDDLAEQLGDVLMRRGSAPPALHLGDRVIAFDQPTVLSPADDAALVSEGIRVVHASTFEDAIAAADTDMVVMVVAHTATSEARRALARLGQLRGAGCAVIADVSADPSQCVAAALAINAGAHGVRGDDPGLATAVAAAALCR